MERDLDLKRSFILRQGGGLVISSQFLIMCGLCAYYVRIMCGLFAGVSFGLWGCHPKLLCW